MRFHNAAVAIGLFAFVAGGVAASAKDAAVPADAGAPAAAAPDAAVPAAAARGGAGVVIAGAGLPEGLRSGSPATPCYALLVAARADLDEPGRIRSLITAARARGLRVVVRIDDAEWQPIGDWFARVQGFAAAIGGDADAWQILGAEGSRLEPRAYAYLLKNARVALRAGGASGDLASLPLPADPAWSEALFAEDAAPYIDIVAAPDVGALAGVTAIRDKVDPRAPIWVTGSPLDAERRARGVGRGYRGATAAGVDVILFVAPAPAMAPPPEAVPAVVLEPGLPVEGEPAEPPPEATPASGEPAVPRPEAVTPAVESDVVAALVFARSQFPPGLRPSAPASLPFNPENAVEGGGTRRPAKIDLSALAFYDVITRDGIAAYSLRPSAGEPVVPPVAVRLTLRSPLEDVDLLIPSAGRT